MNPSIVPGRWTKFTLSEWGAWISPSLPRSGGEGWGEEGPINGRNNEAHPRTSTDVRCDCSAVGPSRVIGNVFPSPLYSLSPREDSQGEGTRSFLTVFKTGSSYPMRVENDAEAFHEPSIVLPARPRS